jgi:GT2 family glycosyltransferase
VRFVMKAPRPAVTIVIPTRDRADLLEACVESVLSSTTYGNFRVMIVDNGSQDPAACELLARYRARGIAVSRDEAEFNFSALNNRAIAQVSTELVCLLNNDVRIVTPEWLEEMAGIATRPGVGAVGARLWFPSGTLQHAGLVLGIAGFAGYAHKNLPRGEGGYASRAVLQQDFSAVTAACLLVRKRIYDEVGGLDESLSVAFNDVDFCLRLRAAGYRNAWTPYAELIHDESASRGGESTPEKVERLGGEMRLLRKRWGKALYEDPCYSPNLTLDREDFSLAWPPRIAGLPIVGEPRSGIYSRIVDAAVDSSKPER